LKLRIEILPEPEIEGGRGVLGAEPKLILPEGGPFGSIYDKTIKTIPLGLVCLPQHRDLIERWIDSMNDLLLDDETNVKRFREFPGAGKAFHARFEVRFVRELDDVKFRTALGLSAPERFDGLFDLYSEAIKSLFIDQGPTCVLVDFPEDVANLRINNPRLTFAEQRALERMQAEDDELQYELFEPTEEEKKAAKELAPQAEDLLFRVFHRALKAKCMLERNCVPLQIIRRQTFVNEEAKQSKATRAWNLGTALYYKSGNIPWQPHGLPADTCFVGISFHHLKRRSGDLVYASVAQAFSNQLEPFALKGDTIPREQTRNKRPYLTAEQAGKLAGRVVKEYKSRTRGSLPSRLVVHKTSHYEEEEVEGFRSELLSHIPTCELLSLSPTGFRLLRRGIEEPDRGTLCTIDAAGDSRNYLFTTGYVRWWKEYPGPHIPSPLEIGSATDTDISERAREVLSLTKVNWNNADGIGRHPITITFARKVGVTMTELGEDDEPNPLYRYYM
jgi:hypothetical protein